MSERSSLIRIEWVVAFCIVAVLGTFYGIAKLTSYRSVERLWKTERLVPRPKISVSIAGCVRRPGSYEVLEGARLKELLKKAGVKPLADLKGVDLGRRLSEGENILVGELKEVSVVVGGCVQEKMATLPAGSRISDLKKIVQTTPDADMSFFKRKRILKEGERIEVPAKNDSRKLSRKQLRKQAEAGASEKKMGLRDLN